MASSKTICNTRTTLVLLASIGLLLLTEPADAAGKMKPGDIFRDCADCPEMVVIPAGSFTMGSVKGRKRELPLTEIKIPRPLAVSRYEVTFDQWDACTADGGCSVDPTDRDWGRGKRPVMSVTFAQVQEYMAWITKKTGHKYRLPSEAEWEYATRAGTKTEYWWGDKMGEGYANCRGCGTEWSGIKSAPVGRFKPNPWGLYDVHGNVLEMTSDCMAWTLEGVPTDGKARLVELTRKGKEKKKCLNRVVKGGAWYYLSKVSRAASRVRNDQRIFSYFIGFRPFREID